MSAQLKISWPKFTVGACRLLVAIGTASLFSSSPQAEPISSRFCPFTFDVSDDLKPEIEEIGGENPASLGLSVKWDIAEGRIVLFCSAFLGEHGQLATSGAFSGEGCEITPSGKYLEICEDAQRWNGYEKLYVFRDNLGEDGGMSVYYKAREGDKGTLYFYMRGDPPYEPDTERLKRAVTAARTLIASITPKTSVQ